MSKSRPTFQSELRLPTRWVAAALAITGTAVLVVSENLPPTEPRLRPYMFCILVYCGAAVIWLLDIWKPRIAQPLAIGALLATVYAGASRLGMPALLSLSGVTTLFAAAAIGLPSAAVTAAIEIGLLVVLSRFSLGTEAGVMTVESRTLSVRLGAILISLGLISLLHYRMQQLGHWLWEHFEQAQERLEETRDRKADLAQALDDLTHANRQLALANERVSALRTIAEDAQKAKATFVAKVSHEFRTPLNMIIGLVSLMRETPEIYSTALSPDMRKDLEIVHRNCEHLAHMVNDVLNLTQMEAGRLVLHRERFDLVETIDSAVQSVRPLLDSKSLDLSCRIPTDLPKVYCDRTRIQQVMLNLVSNAARFTDEGGITIKVRQQAERVVVSVADTGPGISVQDRARIFEPFCQGSTTLWRDTGGTGLGLTISKQFVEMHGGQVWLESELGEGTTFYFSLPISGPIPHLARPGHAIVRDWPWLERRSRVRFPEVHYRPRVVVCDQSGGLYAEFARGSDEVEFVDTRDLREAERAIRECPAHAVVLNAPTHEDLTAYVEQARDLFLGTPLIGCSVPPMTAPMQVAGAMGYLIKPVTRNDFERALKSVGSPVRRVLVVDDDPEVLGLWSRMLHACDPRLSVETASSGQAALDKLDVDRATSSLPDLVLLDVFMPGMDGWQVLERLRGAGQDTLGYPELPVYLVSAHDPAVQPPSSRSLLATMGTHLSVSRLLQATLDLARLFLTPEGALGPEPGQNDGVERAWANSARPLERSPNPLP
jgi:signal transduction histidine kinase/CheY-like chemotaxis protein